MSECKQTCGNCAGRIESLIYKDRCDITEEVIEDMSATCDDWEADRKTRINSLEINLVAAVSQLAKVNEERDALQAQVAVLRGALEELADETEFYYGGMAETVNSKAKTALSTTPSEAAERVNRLVEALEKLARLGGLGGGYGNSDGNVIAQRALAAWREKCE